MNCELHLTQGPAVFRARRAYPVLSGSHHKASIAPTWPSDFRITSFSGLGIQLLQARQPLSHRFLYEYLTAWAAHRWLSWSVLLTLRKIILNYLSFIISKNHPSQNFRLSDKTCRKLTLPILCLNVIKLSGDRNVREKQLITVKGLIAPRLFLRTTLLLYRDLLSEVVMCKSYYPLSNTTSNG